MAKHIQNRDDFVFEWAHRVEVARVYDIRPDWWSWVAELQDWSENHGHGRFFWDIMGDRPDKGELRSVEYYFTDARAAVAFKMRWG